MERKRRRLIKEKEVVDDVYGGEAHKVLFMPKKKVNAEMLE